MASRPGLLPDETVLQLIAPGLLKLKGDNFILDGFPRKASQAQLLDALLEDKGLNLVVELAVSGLFDPSTNQLTDRTP